MNNTDPKILPTDAEATRPKLPPRPLMRERQIAFLEETLLGFGKPHLDILEWGAGGSTRHFTRLLKAHGISYRWISIEHDAAWHKTAAAALCDDHDIEVKWIDAGTSQDNWRTTPMNDYVDYPATLNRQFDFILVDGRKRRRCLLEAKRLLKPEGMVCLHDAQRSYYHCALSAYPSSRFLDRELWCGTNRAASLGRRVLDALNRFYYRKLAKTVESLRRARAFKRWTQK